MTFAKKALIFGSAASLVAASTAALAQATLNGAPLRPPRWPAV